MKMRHSPGQCINRPHNRTGMAQVQTLSRTSTRRVTFRIDEVLNRFMRAGTTNDFRAKMIVTSRCSRSLSSDVSLLDFHTDKFQLRGIDLPNRASLAGALATDFQKYSFFAAAGKTNSNRRSGTCFVAQYFRISRRHWLQKSGNYTALSRVAAD